MKNCNIFPNMPKVFWKNADINNVSQRKNSMSEKINTSSGNKFYNESIQEVCTKHRKILGKNAESIFNTIENVCQNLTAKDYTIGNLYNTFCSAVQKVVNKITSPIAKFIYDISKKIVNFAKEEGETVSDKRTALVESATSMVDATSYIPINENNRLAYYYMSDNRTEAWCADTVKTFVTGISGINSQLEDEIKNIRSVSQW